MNINSSSPNKILIVEDDVASRSLLSSYLSKEGYKITEADQADDLCERVRQEQIDLVLLDINLPGKDGLTLTRELRSVSSVGIILVTSKGDEIDRIVGLELGADDYVTKPFNPRELLVRAKNLLWRVKDSQLARSSENVSSLQWQFEGWTLDSNKRLLTSPGGITERLPEGEFKLLSSLLNAPGAILSRDQLMDAIHDREWTPNDRSVDVMVGRLRRKLDDNPADPHFILTAHGAGYMFAGDVK
ncbi:MULTISPECIES: response regulator [unclassified Neptuniibacter]|uniref:response regulator n=1 Tax=unclassified Neptuniibacter TaxID=2630693 RepID=UPI0025E1C709|nr:MULTISPECIES: response regulator [unclassified Neptuniibacter]|tara:strand:+ start:4044 stop:4775 length:732 start_codon:yes stop_codon:yes gene_type:complete